MSTLSQLIFQSNGVIKARLPSWPEGAYAEVPAEADRDGTVVIHNLKDEPRTLFVAECDFFNRWEVVNPKETPDAQ